jgi:hypothetical protein
MRLPLLFLLSLTLLLCVTLSPHTALAQSEPSAEADAPVAAEAEAADEAEATPATTQKKQQQKNTQKPKKKKTSNVPMETTEGSLVGVDASGLSVDLASGRRARYERTSSTGVRGHKTSWDALAAGDEVRLRLRGKRIHAVIVLPSAEETAAREREREAAIEKYQKGEAARQAGGKDKNAAK